MVASLFAPGGFTPSIDYSKLLAGSYAVWSAVDGFSNAKLLTAGSNISFSIDSSKITINSLSAFVDPEILGADNTGTTDSTTKLQLALDTANAVVPAGIGAVYGRGANVNIPTGVYLTKGGHLMSTWCGVDAIGGLSSVVIKLSAGGSSSYLLSNIDDNGKIHSIGSRPVLRALSFDGTQGTNGEHCIYQPYSLQDKDDAIAMEDTFISGFPGDGVRFDAGHSRIRWRNVKSVANTGWGFNITSSTDSKIIDIGSGRNLQGALKLNNCASPVVRGIDLWVSAGFLGTYTTQLISCRQLVLSDGQNEGIVRVEGDNSNGGAKTRFQDMAHVFNAVTFKVSTDIYTSPNYVGGGGALPYTSLLSISAGNGIRLTNCIFGYGQGSPSATELLATPQYCISFEVPGGGNYNREAGSVEPMGCSFRHITNDHYPGGPSPGGGPPAPVVVPFTKRISNDDYRIAWRGVQPGQLIELPSAHTQINLVKLDSVSTTTLLTSDYPELYLALDRTRTLDTATTNFTIGAATPNSAWTSMFIVAW